MSAEDTKLAITAADEAFKTFSKTTARSRARMLRKMFDLMMENKADLAKIIVAENGKPRECHCWREIQ
jgi:succinate-semialdehyde dehydrogenase/glutarate-semialdehyde dehydrogenase